MTRIKQPGRGWAYAGAIGGGAVSIAANIAHSFLPPGGANPGWHPEPGAVVGAVVWPVFLFIAVEIFARTAWPTGWSWHLVRWAGLLPVAGVAAFVSYRHLSGLLAHYGEEPIICIIGPLAIDGLMVMATGALFAGGRVARTTAHGQTTASIIPARWGRRSLSLRRSRPPGRPHRRLKQHLNRLSHPCRPRHRWRPRTRRSSGRVCRPARQPEHRRPSRPAPLPTVLSPQWTRPAEVERVPRPTRARPPRRHGAPEGDGHRHQRR